MYHSISSLPIFKVTFFLLTLTKQIINNMITIADINPITVTLMIDISNISSVDDSVVSLVTVATDILVTDVLLNILAVLVVAMETISISKCNICDSTYLMMFVYPINCLYQQYDL